MHYAKLPLSAQLVLILDAVRCKSPRYRILINADSLPVSSTCSNSIGTLLFSSTRGVARARRGCIIVDKYYLFCTILLNLNLTDLVEPLRQCTKCIVMALIAFIR